MAFIFFFAVLAFAVDTVNEFSLKTVDGKTIAYRAANRIPMVVNIGAHWWPECKKEAPELQKAFQDYGSKGIGFIGVFVLSSADDIREFVETFKLTFPVGRESGIAEKLGVRGIPVTVFLDRNGKVTKRHIGVITYEELVANIEPLLK